MTARKLNRAVAELLPHVGGADALLRMAAKGMREKQIPRKLADLQEVLRCDDALGQIYQAINAPALESAYRATSNGRKFTRRQIPCVTQLFTPRWVVEFLLENSLGQMWLAMHPDSRLRKKWKWLVHRQLDPEPIKPVSEIRICDPACGTMNFGLAAVDMLRHMYREELLHAGRNGWPKPSCDSVRQIDAFIIRNNLFGFEIDAKAVHLAVEALEVKTGARSKNLILRDGLSRGGGMFDIVVTNPPYLSARNLPRSAVDRLKRRFPDAWRDVYACFILRASEMLRPGGRAGILAMHSFMFTGGFEGMRKQLAEQSCVEILAHFGPGLFEVGNPGTLQTAAFVLQKIETPKSSAKAICFRLINADDKRRALRESISRRKSSRRFKISQAGLQSSPRGAWMYWLLPPARRAFAEFPSLGKIAPPRQGLATSDNTSFVRYWWEVEPPNFNGPRPKWMKYAKGGGFRRWHEPAMFRVNWENDGAQIKREIVRRYPYLNGKWQWVAKNSAWYGKAGITYSYLTSGRFSARRLEAGAIFDVAGSSLFPKDPLPILAVLNSTAARRLLEAINPTVNFQVGDLRQLPIPEKFPRELDRDVQSAIELIRETDSCDETQPTFVRPAPWRESLEIHHTELGKIENRIDQIVSDLYRMKHERTRSNGSAKFSRRDLARRWISYALGKWLGRWGSAKGEVAVVKPLDQKLAIDLRDMLGDDAEKIEHAVGGLEAFLEREFLEWHDRMYRFRPVFWGFSIGGRTVVSHGLSVDSKLMGSLGLPPVSRNDDPIWRKLATMVDHLADRHLRKVILERTRRA